MSGKSINLFLMDGTANGRIKCTLANWTGVGYKIPRTELEQCKNREDLAQSGVYFLFGRMEESERQVMYVGQAGVRKNGEGILYRLQEHKRNPDKDYWSEAVVFTTSNNSFGPTEISWLENQFCAIAREANRYHVKNGNDPTCGNVTEEKESELEEFVEYAKIIMGVLGHKVFEPLLTRKPLASPCNEQYKNRLLTLRNMSKKTGKTIQAQCEQTAEGFVVLAGSQIDQINSETISTGVKAKRKDAKMDANGQLLEDVLFNSPSYAAMFVLGRSANGLTSWKTETGKTLKDLEQES